MLSPAQKKAGSGISGFRILTSQGTFAEAVEDREARIATDNDDDTISISNSANTNTNTHINTNDTDSDETWTDTDSATVMNDATGTEDPSEVVLTAIDGKLHFLERSGRAYPMETLPDELKQWIKDECRDTRKKDEWIQWLMEAPLDPDQFDGACMTPYSELEAPEGLKSALKRSLDDLNDMYADMERSKLKRDQSLDDALQWDFNYQSAKKDIEWYTMVIKKSLE